MSEHQENEIVPKPLYPDRLQHAAPTYASQRNGTEITLFPTELSAPEGTKIEIHHQVVTVQGNNIAEKARRIPEGPRKGEYVLENDINSLMPNKPSRN